MKRNTFTRIFAQPVLMLAAAGVIIVEGEKTFRLFAQYFVFNLASGNVFAIVGAVGLLMLLVSFMDKRLRSSRLVHPLLNIFGAILLMGSMALFFYWLPWTSCYGTFTHALPLATLCFFAITSIGFIVVNLFSLVHAMKD